MKLRKLYAPLLMVLLLIGSCKDEEVVDPAADPTFTLRFNTNWNGDTFELFEYYENVTGYNVKFDDFKFYVSDIILTKADGSEHQLSEVEFFNLKQDIMSKSFSIPKGDYTGIKYSWGVPVALNGTDDPDNFDAADYPEGHPLSIDNGMYWAWAPGYRFVVFDGRYDDTPSTTTDTPMPFSIHVGTDQTFTPVEVTGTNFSFSNNDIDYQIDMDMSRAFYTETDTIDLAIPEDNQAHVSNIQLSLRLMNNIVEASQHSID